MPKYLFHHAFIIVKMYVVNRIIWTWPPVVVMFTCCFILCRCLRNMWWFVTHRHPSKQCPVCLSTNIVLTAGYATHVWNYIMSSCRKIHNPYKFEEAFHLVSKGVSCERISRIIYIYIHVYIYIYIYIYCREHYVHGRTGYKCRFNSTISHFQWVSNVFHISLKFTHAEQCKDHWTPMYQVKLPQVSVSMRRKKIP